VISKGVSIRVKDRNSVSLAIRSAEKLDDVGTANWGDAGSVRKLTGFASHYLIF
jgi:hypothetical protein